MPHMLQRYCRICCRWLVARAIHAWHEAPPVPRAVSAGLEIPLVPSPLARRVRRIFLVLQGLYGIELLWRGHWVAAAAIAAIALLPWLCGRGGAQPRQMPRRLLLAADGRLHILTAAGELEAVRLHPSSLRLGPWLILLLSRTGDKPHRLLLGPDNMDAATLAALRRRMVLVDQLAEAVMPGLQAGRQSGIRVGSPDVAKQHGGQDVTPLR